MKRTGYFIYRLLWATLVSVPATAQDKTDSIGLLNEVTVIAQRKENKEQFVPFTVHSVNPQALDQYSPRTVPEALMSITGVFVQKTNHGGGSPFLRGLTGNQSLLMYDGIRLNNAIYRYGPNQYLNTVDAYALGRIEIAKGTGSVQYGSDAIGGVIQLYSNDLKYSSAPSFQGTGASAKYMTGDMEKTIRGQFAYSNKKMALTGGITARRFGDLIGGDSTGKQFPSGYDEIANDIKIRFKVSEHSNLTFNHNMVDQSDVPVYHKVVLENFAVNMSDRQRRMLQYLRYDLTTRNRLLDHAEFTIAHQQNVEKRSSRKNGSDVLRKEMDKVSGMSGTLDIFSNFAHYWTANSGMEFYSDRVNSSRNDLKRGGNTSLRGLYPDGSFIRNFSIYTLHHLDLKDWKIDLGVRYQSSTIKITDTTLGNVTLRPGSLVGNFAVLHDLGKGHAVYTSVSTGYRAPNIDDLGTLGIVDFRYEVPTNDLASERSLHAELGYKFRGRKLNFSTNLFILKLQDLITRNRKEGEVIAGYPVYTKENTESALINGVEMEFSIRPFKGVSIESGVAYTYGWNETRQEPLRRIPPVHGRILSRYSKGNAWIAGEMQYAGKQSRLAKGDKDDNRIPKGGTPGFNVLNLHAGYRFSSLSLNVSAINLFNEDYRTHGSGINGYGRSLSLQLIYSIR